uniref:Uncharacterized protein n=1 Tax=Auxenochlorella protothecoides TaxID=3075 RepID=A0A1Y0JY57_AUXPR|nr:hypothetical protein BW920_0016 [Auxenochlorella protothecoides]
MGYPGFEPGACRLKAEYSTIELVTLISIYFNLYIFKKSINKNLKRY